MVMPMMWMVVRCLTHADCGGKAPATKAQAYQEIPQVIATRTT